MRLDAAELDRRDAVAELQLACGQDGEPCRLHSHFQTILSLAHGRAVGVEGLLRSSCAGQSVPPALLFQRAAVAGLTAELDRHAVELHLRAFGAQQRGDLWLFLNMLPEVALDFPSRRHEFEASLHAYGLRPQQLVIEILESEALDMGRLAATVVALKQMGCLVAIDDFGAGHSNIDRIWRLEPDIVKLDRSLIAGAAHTPRLKRILPSLIALLHEAGAMVVAEGVETAEEALVAMDSDADFVQGFHFARPQPLHDLLLQPVEVAESLWDDFHELCDEERRHYREELAPYLAELQRAARSIEAGVALAEACADFLALPQALRCFVLDEDGRQLGSNLSGHRRSGIQDGRFAPLADAEGARWSRRHYFRRALHQPGVVQLTRPYLSLTGAHLCVTLSVAVRFVGTVFVVCGDVDWKHFGDIRHAVR